MSQFWREYWRLFKQYMLVACVAALLGAAFMFIRLWWRGAL